MQEKTIGLIIRVAEIIIGIALLIKDIFNGGGKNDNSGASKKK